MPDDHNKDETFEGRTYLLIRTHPQDNGTEPLAAGLPFWTSPDITIVKPDGTRGGEAVAGATNQVEVAVTNKGGIPAVDAYVDAFVADPSTSFTPATAAPIGGTFVTVQGYSVASVSFPWVPGAAAAGHRCLLARVSLVVPPDTYLNGAVFDVVGDRHVAQRNIHVVSLAGAQKSLSFAFALVNPLGKEAEFTLQAREVKLARGADVVRKALGCALVPAAAAPLDAVRLVIEDRKPEEEGDTLRDRPGAFGVLRRPKDVGRSQRGRVALAADETRTAVVTLTGGGARAGVNLVEVRQTAVDGAVVGGLWLVAVG